MSTLIAITGGSGAGKTTIAQALARQVGAGAVVVAEDDYYRCASTIPDFDAASYNFDTPEAKEHTLLSAHLAAAKRGEPFDKPIYDLATHRRQADLERIARANVVIVEGIHLLAVKDLRGLFDLKIFVEADEAVRLARRMLRDVETRGRTPRSVMMQFFETVRPMHQQHVESQRAFADLVLHSPHNAGPVHAEASARRILEALGAL